jgi:hypothetical protein
VERGLVVPVSRPFTRDSHVMFNGKPYGTAVEGQQR